VILGGRWSLGIGERGRWGRGRDLFIFFFWEREREREGEDVVRGIDDTRIEGRDSMGLILALHKGKSNVSKANTAGRRQLVSFTPLAILRNPTRPLSRHLYAWLLNMESNF